MPTLMVGWPEILALVEISGCPRRSTRAFTTFERDWRMASRPVLPVTLSGTLAAAGTMMVSGPGQKWRTEYRNVLSVRSKVLPP